MKDPEIYRLTMKDPEIYRLTLLGFFQIKLGDKEGRRIYDALDIYCRRNDCGIAVEDNRLGFVNLEPVQEAKP